jgi:hypothetical protein
MAGNATLLVNEPAGSSFYATVSFSGATLVEFPEAGLNGMVFWIVRLGDNIPLPS